MLIYAVFLVVGKISKRAFPKIGDLIVLVLIFSISLWGGAQISGNSLTSVLLDSLLFSLLVVLITFGVGLVFKKSAYVRDRTSLVYTQLKYGAPLVLGLIAGLIIRPSLNFSEIINYELFALAAIIGLNMGSEIKFRAIFRVTKDALLTLIVVIVGGVISAFLLFFVGAIPSLKLAMVMFLGAGWYSYTGPIVSAYFGPVYGVEAFLVNFLREQLAFLFVPLLIRAKPNPYSAIAIGGATSMDTTLGMYSSIFSGEYSVSAMMSGAILTLIIPIILPLILVT
ncbi:DUF340 domain-containing protein [Metallosphaera hakonensis JCM 8857 = DSM 7519]|uniref:DUF340 domain-containing protein n=2 Tax=Metallosphaera hakonensis TaxID=79601 RepID=A0A2U9IWY0_9CREN|nr:DUF340 domain-containing protein [Metallosphaera hakonensis JCM 8857 = DSM 7519]